jgi:exopolysaccharide production protein ExoZ
MKRQILSIQYLRGIAALLVVFYHVLQEVGRYVKNSLFLDFYELRHFGQVGVDVFFVISGFVMMYVHGNDFQKSNISLKFLKRRIIRVVPLYWILTSFTAFLLYFKPEFFGGGKVFNFLHVVCSFLFIPAKNSVGLTLPVLGPGWSLNFEMYFYILFAILLMFNKKYLIRSLSIIFVVSVFCSLFPFDEPLTNMLTNPMLFEFLFGIILAYLMKNENLKNYSFPIVFGTILMSSNIYFHFNIDYRVFFYGIPSALIIMGLIAYEDKIGFGSPNKFLMFLANISYSVYLSHVFAYKITLFLLPRFILSNYPDLVVIFCLISSVILGYVVYKIIEIPLTKLLKNF